MPDRVDNLYLVLGVDADADLRTIQRAFRTLARDAHPDVGGDAERFRSLRDAYEVLIDAERRREHDERLGIRGVAPDDAASRGWSGRHGTFTGDVVFPTYLRDVVEGPWQAAPSTGPRPGDHGAAKEEPDAPGPLELRWRWRWSQGATWAPVAADPIVVLTGGTELVGLDGASGEEVWRTDLGAAVAVQPVRCGAVVVVALAGGSVEAVEAATGTLRWRHHLGAPPAAGLAGWEERVVVGAGAAVVAIDTADGRRRWATKLPTAPVQLCRAGGHLVVATAGGTLHGLDLGRGRQRWWLRTGPAADPPPCAVDDAVWLVAGGGRLARLASGTGAVTATVAPGLVIAGMAAHRQRLLVTTAGPPRLLALGADGELRWARELPAVCPAPAVVGDRVAVVEPSGALRWFAAANGAVVAAGRLPFEPAGLPVAAGGQVVVGDRHGAVWAVGAPGGVDW